MRRTLLYTSISALVAVSAIRCGGKPTIVQEQGGGSGGRHGGGQDAAAGGDFTFSTGGADAGSCNPDSGNCDDAGPGYEPRCGDGRINPGEACDDGNVESKDGCTANCQQVEADYACPDPGKPCKSTVSCGDRAIGGGETCDDGNQSAHDGCDDTCQVETGWACPIVGIRCEAAKCGDSIVAGSETCDDGNAEAKDGCSDVCQLEDGFACDTPGQKCKTTTCGDGKTEGSERCDDGNDDLGDGCTPLCQLEPNCDQGACISPCGDGIKFTNEDCDDGNKKDGDGCSSDCKVEKGYTCTLLTDQEPTSIGIPIVLRDFEPTHPDFELDRGDPKEPDGDDHAIVRTGLGAPGDTFLSGGVPYSMNHKPVYANQGCTKTATPSAANSWDKCTLTTFNASSFQQWYRDVPGVNTPHLQVLTLNRIGANAYRFDSAANGSDGFFPLDAFGTSGQECSSKKGHNFHFTSEVRYWFEYSAAAPPTLEFSGDDDVFVFVNHQLVMDLGGIHGREDACFTLSPNGSGFGNPCPAPAAPNDKLYDHQRVFPVTGLEDGKIFEIAVFQAERNTCASNYKLTLTNFLASKSLCKSKCGDGVVTPDEVCDDGPEGNDGSYGKCAKDCKSRGPYCGDHKIQKDQGEQCDDGSNVSQYGGCAPGCVKGPYCGDGDVQSSAGEECDDGKLDGAYGGCAEGCVLGPRCGDNHVQAESGEECDDGNQNPRDGCTPTCKRELTR